MSLPTQIAFSLGFAAVAAALAFIASLEDRENDLFIADKPPSKSTLSPMIKPDQSKPFGVEGEAVAKAKKAAVIAAAEKAANEQAAAIIKKATEDAQAAVKKAEEVEVKFRAKDTETAKQVRQAAEPTPEPAPEPEPPAPVTITNLNEESTLLGMIPPPTAPQSTTTVTSEPSTSTTSSSYADYEYLGKVPLSNFADTISSTSSSKEADAGTSSLTGMAEMENSIETNVESVVENSMESLAEKLAEEKISDFDFD